MNSDLEKSLINKYPELFQSYGGDPKETCMAWGCECDDGWYDLIDSLCAYIAAICNHKMMVSYKDGYVKTEQEEQTGLKNEHIDPPKVKFQQIKEKFAGLRIYFSMYHDISDEEYAKLDEQDYQKQYDRYYADVNAAIEFASFLSHRTCEICGKKGEVYRDGWWKTLCDEHGSHRLNVGVNDF